MSRTQLAAQATRTERALRAQDALALARSVAEQAGLPIEEDG